MDNKDVYIQKLHERVDKWNAELDNLYAEANKTTAESRVEFQNQMENLREKRQVVEHKIAEMREASEGAWEELKSGVRSAWDSMEEALKSAQSRFK